MLVERGQVVGTITALLIHALFKLLVAIDEGFLVVVLNTCAIAVIVEMATWCKDRVVRRYMLQKEG